jgi:hypothetical protein
MRAPPARIPRAPGAAPGTGAAAVAPAHSPAAAAVLALQRSQGNRAVTRRLARRTRWSEQATPENRRRAEAMDRLERLTNQELVDYRARIAAQSAGPKSDEQDRAARTLEDIEGVAAQRDVAPLKPDWNVYSRRSPVVRRLNVRALIEEEIRSTGSFETALKRFSYGRDAIESDLDFFKAEAERFRREFRSQARRTADRMLDGSQIGLRDVLRSYGLDYDAAKGAAKRLAHGTSELDDETERLVQLANVDETINDPAKVKKRVALANQAGRLRGLQQTYAQRVKEAEAAVKAVQGQGSRGSEPDAAAEARKWAAYRELQAEYAAAERLHPVLTALRRDGGAEGADLSKLDTNDVNREMRAVAAEVLPRLRDIAKARGRLQDGHLDPLTLPSVVAITRQNMFIPKGSLRDGIVNDLVSDAADDADSFWMMVAAFALAIITLIPSAGASLAIPAGVASVTLAAYTATKEWGHYQQLKVLSNTDLDLARSLSTEEPSLTGFVVSLVAAGFELIPLVRAFNKARRIKALVGAGEDTNALVRELNAMGRTRGRANLGDEALRDIKATTKVRAAATAADAIPAADTLNQLARPVVYKTAAELEAGLGGAIRSAGLRHGVDDLNPMMRDLLRTLTGKPDATLADLAKLAKDVTLNKEGRDLLKQLPKAYAALRDPAAAERAAARVFKHAAGRKPPITTREALEELVGGGTPVEVKVLEEDIERFRKVIAGDPPFRDLAFAADHHGAHTHMFQELIVDEALGGKGAGRAFRKLIARVDGPAVAETTLSGRPRPFWSAVWDALFDDFGGTGHLNDPESIGGLLQTHLGLPRWEP